MWVVKDFWAVECLLEWFKKWGISFWLAMQKEQLCRMPSRIQRQHDLLLYCDYRTKHCFVYALCAFHLLICLCGKKTQFLSMSVQHILSQYNCWCPCRQKKNMLSCFSWLPFVWCVHVQLFGPNETWREPTKLVFVGTTVVVCLRLGASQFFPLQNLIEF